MRIAILQKTAGHSEVFGFLLQRFISEDIDIYAKQYSFWYIPYYEQLFSRKLSLFPPSQLMTSKQKYDVIIITTSSNITDDEIQRLKTKANRILSILHIPKHYRQINLALTPLIPRCTYLFPVYDGNSTLSSVTVATTPTIAPITGAPPKFIVVGALGPRNVSDLAKAVNMTKSQHSYTVEIFSSTPIKPQNTNVIAHYRESTEQLIKSLKESKFLLSIPKPNSYYYSDRLTGELPLAYSHGIPICLPKRLNAIYKLKGVVEYNHSITEVFTQLITMSPDTYTALVQAVIDDRDDIIAKNNAKLTKLIS